MDFKKIPILNQVKFIRKKELEKYQNIDEIERMLFKKDLEIFKLNEEKEIIFNNLKTKIKKLQKITDEKEKSEDILLNILEDLKENEKTIKIQQKILEDTIQYFLHGIILFGENEKILLTNQKTFEIFNIAEIDIKNKNYKALEEGEHYSKILEFLREKNRTEKEISFDKYHLKINKIVFENNRDINFLIILNDITKEKGIRQTQADFIALTAHQLRTPLSGIKWTLEMFLDGSLGKIDQEQKKYITQLNNNVNRLISIVGKFLDVARIEQGRLIEKKEKYDMVELINIIIKSSKLLLKENEISLSFNFSEDIIRVVEIDVEKIKIVIQNLLENAIKYSKNEAKIKIDLKNHKKYLIFSIQDNGCGIPTEEQEKIFNKFFRSSNAKKVDTEGSGMGLFVIKNIIEAHNGNIWFRSGGENKGTIFYFTLPI